MKKCSACDGGRGRRCNRKPAGAHCEPVKWTHGSQAEERGGHGLFRSRKKSITDCFINKKAALAGKSDSAKQCLKCEPRTLRTLFSLRSLGRLRGDANRLAPWPGRTHEGEANGVNTWLTRRQTVLPMSLQGAGFIKGLPVGASCRTGRANPMQHGLS